MNGPMEHRGRRRRTDLSSNRIAHAGRVATGESPCRHYHVDELRLLPDNELTESNLLASCFKSFHERDFGLCGIEDFTNFGRQDCRRERLLEEESTGIKNSMMDDCVGGVSGHVEHLDLGVTR